MGYRQPGSLDALRLRCPKKTGLRTRRGFGGDALRLRVPRSTVAMLMVGSMHRVRSGQGSGPTGPSGMRAAGCGLPAWLSRAAGSSRAGSYINSPSGSRAQPGKGAVALCPLLFLSHSPTQSCCRSPLAWGERIGNPPQGRKRGKAMAPPSHALPGEGSEAGGDSVPLALSWEQGRLPPREAGAYSVTLMISNEQLPLVSPLISEYQ